MFGPTPPERIAEFFSQKHSFVAQPAGELVVFTEIEKVYASNERSVMDNFLIEDLAKRGYDRDVAREVVLSDRLP